MIKKVQSWLPVRVLMAFGASQAGSYAGALAFAGLLSMFPLMLGVVSIVGFSIRDPATEARFQTLLIQAFPATTQPELMRALNGVKQSAGWLGLVSIGGVIWSASSIFATLEFAFAQIYGTHQRDFVRQKLMGLVMMVLLVVAIGLTVGANALAGLLPNSFSWVVGFAIGSVVMVALLTLLYRFVPNRAFAIRDVLPGAILAGVGIEALSLVFPLYIRYAGGFNTYGAQFALFFLLAAWFFLLSNLILLGAVYNKFRLGQPVVLGLIASPSSESRVVKRPAEAIEEHKRPDEAPARVEARKPRRHSRVGQRIVGYVLVGLALAAKLFPRRGSHTIKT
jgi:membrane protein